MTQRPIYMAGEFKPRPFAPLAMFLPDMPAGRSSAFCITDIFITYCRTYMIMCAVITVLTKLVLFKVVSIEIKCNYYIQLHLIQHFLCNCNSFLVSAIVLAIV